MAIPFKSIIDGTSLRARFTDSNQSKTIEERLISLEPISYWKNVSNGTISPYIGEIKTITVAGKSYRVRCIGHNHDEIYGGDGEKARTTWELFDCLETKYAMNDIATNKTGNTLMDRILSTNAELFQSLPDNLRPYIKAIVKKTAEGSISATASNIISNPCRLFLLSAEEVFGTVYGCTNIVSGEIIQIAHKGEGNQYELYKKALIPSPTQGSGNFLGLRGWDGTFYTSDKDTANGFKDRFNTGISTVANNYYNYEVSKLRKYSSINSSTNWWLRSPTWGSGSDFVTVNYSSSLGTSRYNTLNSLSFCFCV